MRVAAERTRRAGAKRALLLLQRIEPPAHLLRALLREPRADLTRKYERAGVVVHPQEQRADAGA